MYWILNTEYSYTDKIASISTKLLKNVKVTFISKGEADLKTLTIQSSDFILGGKCVTSCHAA